MSAIELEAWGFPAVGPWFRVFKAVHSIAAREFQAVQRGACACMLAMRTVNIGVTVTGLSGIEV